jgi:hypothetical protein
LDGSKEFTPFEFVDWWDLAHPDDPSRDRVIEYGGYRITWDDDEPEFPSSLESGIRFGHVRRITPKDDQLAELELRSGTIVELSGGSTDLGDDLRELLVTDSRGRTEDLEWEEIRTVEFFPAPAGAQPSGRRFHGTVELEEGLSFTGYLSWDVNQVLTTDTLDGRDSDGRTQSILFGRISEVRPSGDGAEISLTDGTRLMLSDNDDVDSGNDGIQVADPGLGFLDIDWDDIERVRFHEPEASTGSAVVDDGLRLKGTVMTTDSTELTGWIRWDGDEEYAWELLDGQSKGVTFDIEFGHILSIGKGFEGGTSINVGPMGVAVTDNLEEVTQVTLVDGRMFELHGSNDVDEDNHGIFVLPENGGTFPDDEQAEWILVRWEDFQSLRLEWGEGR